MKNLRFAIIALLAITAVAAGAQNNPEKAMKKLANVQWALTNMYVDPVNLDSLVEEAIRAELRKLDPHSEYTTAEETKEMSEPLQGSFSGIGIQFNMQQDTLYVIQTVAGGPSERVGILAGDRIVQVEDSVIAGVKMKTTAIQKKLRGPKGTFVNVKVLRRGVPELLSFRIKRADIPIYSLDAAYMLDKKTGYVKISRFAQTTSKEFLQAVDSLKRHGMEDIIVDLCNNGGGFMQPAIEMSNEFLQRGDMIVFTKGRTDSQYSEARAQGKGKMGKCRVVVLVDQYSASASEIFSGAIQDNDRGLIVGRRTFGKGLVQRPLEFEDGSMMRLTVARYHTPSGRCIQKPYTKGDELGYAMDIVNRYKEGELQNADSIHNDTRQKFQTLRNKRTVYGGGGITPDVFVPIDTTGYSPYYRDLMAKGIYNSFAMKYVENNRKTILQQHTTLADFDARFTVGDDMLKEVIAMGERDSVHFKQADYDRSEKVIKLVLKALVARDVYSDPSAYYMVVNHDNNILKTAIELLADRPRYEKLLK